MRGVGRAIERNAVRLGLPPRRRIEDCLSPCLQISQMVPSLDFPRKALPPGFHYTGPFRGEAPGSFELPPGDDRPLVYCTLGTLQGSRSAIFRKVAQACEALDLRLLITQGNSGGLKPGDLPGDPLIHDWVPQEAVLGHADLVVCHGGMNTVLDLLAEGLPLVLMPLAFEQSAIAARLDHAGVAKVLSRRTSARRLAEAMDEARTRPSFRYRASAVRIEIGESGGAAQAAGLIEMALT
jgi:zeaxanthin glucosyltransferase